MTCQEVRRRPNLRMASEKAANFSLGSKPNVICFPESKEGKKNGSPRRDSCTEEPKGRGGVASRTVPVLGLAATNSGFAETALLTHSGKVLERGLHAFKGRNGRIRKTQRE